MKILSIDVGIKNLAFCLFSSNDNEYNIVKWDSINLAQQIETRCCEREKFKDCNKPAKFTKNGKCYCLKHSKKQPFLVPSSDFKSSFINKQKIKGLYDIADKYKIPYETPIKKVDLIECINHYVFNTCFEQITPTNASAIDLITIGKNMKTKLDTILYDHIDTITHVIIENQISPIANRMKTVQGMIAQYFIMKNSDVCIEFISAANKLKNSDTGPNSNVKTSYSERKKQGIQQCLEIINTKQQYSSWETFFKSHSKKDDLADSFLQGIWFISSKVK
uniref:Mitochondrial resolvase Ydc2 catalytic domain-containing protein n=1 Tax=viral metagenome TaxID=1070528 RepID=A0A6C0B1G0_9ZZZZ